MNNGKQGKGSTSQKNGKGYQGKSRSNFHKGKGNYRDRDNNDTRSKLSDPKGSNDPGWYNQAGQLAFGAARIPFNNPLGAPEEGIMSTAYMFPGVAGIHFVPTLGETRVPADPINMVAFSMMTDIKSKVSMQPNFAAADLMMYFGALNSILGFYAQCVRAYAVYRTYSQMNRYLPAYWYKAMGWTVTEQEDWARFRYWLNKFAVRLSQLYVPSKLTYFQRILQLCSNIYMDAPSDKAQSYLFTLDYIYQWTSSTESYGTKLEAVSMQNKTLEQIMTIGDTLITNLITDLDVAYISAMLIRTYGAENQMVIPTVGEDFMITAVYNPEILLQIRNMTICGDLDVTGTRKYITQAATDSIAARYFTLPVGISSDISHLWFKRMLDIPYSPTGLTNEIDINFVATRLMVIGDSVDAETGCHELMVFGTEVVTKVYLYSMNEVPLEICSSVITNAENDYLLKISKASNFCMFPVLYLAERNLTTKVTTFKGIMFEVNNYTALDDRDLKLLHTAAIVAMFNRLSPVSRG